MKGTRCQHENAPTMKFCGECGAPLRPNTPSYPDPKGEVENLRQALTEALVRQGPGPHNPAGPPAVLARADEVLQ